MDAIGLGWRTDLAVLRYGGSAVEEHPDHLVVRTPANPTYHWGNFVLVTDPEAADDADRWRARFGAEFPEARHLAIGLPGQPDAAAWQGTEIEASDVLVATGAVATRDLADGYTVRPIESAEDWAASTALNDEHYPGELEFARLRSQIRSRMVEAGHLTWFGAFTLDGDRLVSELGIVPVEAGLARYQSVLTHTEHRRRGLTGHLLGVAAQHARSAGETTLVIIADANSAAGRLYRAAGFAHTETAWQAYVPPARESD
ncbi:GNAT family N-acetyltransferase [Nocardioides marmorisolisilvae]|uniref:GNAT family N-acetyltransferase n=1 Tax=Nocardioides marmorisolisilvae TaxID=1542737 RepID=A0A3N0DV63_9ACTN|nr:GNAT family N-acetyltransferase [Nocardioides marmorisolisilvae]RNL79514.1 GNAT family N-acetyltransferase [Nocardioides marmorisolisilvae]